MPFSRSLLPLLLACTPAALPAQRLWLDPALAGAVTVEIAGGVFNEALEKQPIMALTARIREPLGDSLALVVELPAAYVRAADGASAGAIGNPYLGIEFRQDDGVAFEIGARPGLARPSSRDDLLPWAYGQVLNFDRPAAWYPRASTVHAAVQLDGADRPGMITSLKVGLDGSLVSGSGGDLLAALYAGRVGLRRERWEGWVGVVGRGALNTGGTIAQRTIHQAEFGVTTRGGAIELGVTLRRFLGEGVGGSIPILVLLQARGRI